MVDHQYREELQRCNADWRAWFAARSMPLWHDVGTDREYGGFHERIDESGLVLRELRRTRVVSRQIYVGSVARGLGWSGDDEAWMRHGLMFLQGRLRQPSGYYAASVHAEGAVGDGRFDLYEQAFALFAMASALPHLSEREAVQQMRLARETLGLLFAKYKHPNLGFQESDPPSAPLKANPHMHLLEASLAWEALGSPMQPVWREMSDELVDLALRHLIDPLTGAQSEYFNLNWDRARGPGGDVVEPGHQFEWAWLLMRWGRSRARPDAMVAARRLIEIGEQHGTCAARGVAINQINHSFGIVDAKAKIWPQTERLKAWCGLAEAADGEQARASALAGVLEAEQGLRAFVSPAEGAFPVNGLWQEVMLPDGSFTREPCRASSFYHVVCALDNLNNLATSL
jgi:mannose/cellobiose epimerase-like protein (N-acyl-D-glucosamine 2-epimerase family)